MLRILGTFKSGSPDSTHQRFTPNGTVFADERTVSLVQTPTYGVSVTFDMDDGNIVVINATNNVAFAVNAPLNPLTGQQMILVIKNTSGGALGAITFNAVFKMPAFTAPATGFQRSMHFYFDGTNWREVIRGSDAAN